MNMKKQAPNQGRTFAYRLPQDTKAGVLKVRSVLQAMSGLALAALVWGSSILGYALQTVDSPGSENDSLDHIVTGTLDQLDFDSGKGLLKTDLGKPIFFDMVLPDLFRRLSIGQRVTIGINEQGQATKVMEIPPVELPSSGAH